MRHPIAIVLTLALLCWGCSKGAEKPETVEPPVVQKAVEMTGETLFRERCRDCHKVHGEGGVVGPDLSDVGAKRDRAFLEQVLREPSKLYPGTVMPPYDSFSAKQIDLLVEYLSGLR